MGKLSKKKIQRFSTEELNKLLGDAWLNISVDEDKLFNPLDIPLNYEENPEIYITWLLMQPEYFSFICSEILNVNLIPMQGLMLKETWNRRFPMWIASRGASKSFMLGVYALLRILLMPEHKVVITGAAFRQSKVIFEYMESIWHNAPILRDIVGTQGKNGPRRDVDMCRFNMGRAMASALPLGTGEKIRGQRANTIQVDEFSCLHKCTLIQTTQGLVRIKDYLDGNVHDLINRFGDSETPDKIMITPKTDVYKIMTQNGYMFKCSSIHKVMTLNGWKIAKDLTTNDFLELTFNDYFPTQYIEQDSLTLDENMGWLMGMLVAEGTNTNRNFVNITTTDHPLIETVNSRIQGNWKVYTRPPHKDPRGWNCKEAYDIKWCNTKLRGQLYSLGLDYVTSHTKTIPWAILQSPRTVVLEFLRGIYEGDGSAFNYDSKGKKRIGVTYYSVCEELVSTLQILLLKFGITCTKTQRKSKISKNPQWMLACRGSNAEKLHELLCIEKWNHVLNNGQCFRYKPYIRANGNRFVVSTNRANKNLHIGTFDTEEECMEAFEKYQEKLTPVFRVKSVEKLDKQEVLYDFHLPETHSFFGNGFIQHNSIPREIFENVIAGFAAVKDSPIESVKAVAAQKMAEFLGVDMSDQTDKYSMRRDNQIIISGTAYYDFNHFAEYWKNWKAIIMSRGRTDKLNEIFKNNKSTEGAIPENFDWKDYSIFRIPFELVPKGFMDDAQVARSKATIHAGIYEMEFGSIFSSDSNGFFKRTLIESCVISSYSKIAFNSDTHVDFTASLKGKSGKSYVYGVDTASEVDNFSIIILEQWPEHRRVVYGWITNRQKHRVEIKAGLTTETDFYSYCGRKIRDLMTKFPCERIMMDSQGGGVAVREALHDQDKIKDGEVAIWPVIDPDKEKDTDTEIGQHLLELVNFASAEWTGNANHGMRKDMEDKVLLFPRFDAVVLANATGMTEINTSIYDTIEDCVLEIEELKTELSIIIITQTPSGRDKWDSPEVKLPGGKKGRIRKDRYSALVMANMGARELMRNPTQYMIPVTGGFAGQVKNTDGAMYTGNKWFAEASKAFG